MEVERVEADDGTIQLWGYDWDLTSNPPMKRNRRFLTIEQPVMVGPMNTMEAICWSYGRTLGNIAVFNHDVIGAFPGLKGDDALLNCEIVPAGRWQNGTDRWWCRTHQSHWGRVADRAASDRDGAMRCAQHGSPMSYVVNPPRIYLHDYAEVGIWCSLPAAFTSNGEPPQRRPKIHVHLRDVPNGPKIVDQDFDALALQFAPPMALFPNTGIDTVHVTPPAAKEFVLSLENGTPMGCVQCTHCRFPHLDLGDFARRSHRKHLCGNCGRDHTWTPVPMTSTPLKPLHDAFSAAWQYVDVAKVLNIDEHPGATFALWASTPAIVWTAQRPQERGIHVHLSVNGRRMIDDTFGTVIYHGQELNRQLLLAQMIANTMD
ncbi:hypothetical protein [Collimonas humicola]|uniref:hypothetical protein n=1 Tax=Collimonas humicola TaxID=2825886 RepID=UPI001B8D8955|nr:hypothetical protein [Collimonas humicola]